MSNSRDAAVTSFNESIRLLMRNIARMSLRSPSLAISFLRMAGHQRRALRTRERWATRGVHVPPMAMATVTGRCNLHCEGCYARAEGREHEAQMSADKLRSVVAEAHELGISVFLITGGEPLTRPELLDITGDYPDMLFPMFTNGLLIDDRKVEILAQQKHVIPLISLEGYRVDTDARRDAGVHDRVVDVMRRLGERSALYGTSITLTRYNFDLLEDTDYLRSLMRLGCRLFVLVNYIPLEPGTEFMALTDAQRAQQASLIDELHRKLPGLFVSFPADEAAFGGCLAAGHGLFHIAPSGSLEPCPFSPFSDTSLQDESLKEAPQSPLFRALREHSGEFKQVPGSCVLWENRAWLEETLAGHRLQEHSREPVAV